jgi:two-component system OmpR family response regulator
MAEIILLEDERILRRELADFLTKNGHVVAVAASLAEFNQGFQPERHAIAIIDIGLPDGNGFDLVRHLRQQKMNLGIIILTARSSTPDKLIGLNCGADHYLPKSTDLDELAAVVAALARRLAAGGFSQRWIVQSAGLRLVPPGESPIELSAQDYSVLCLIVAGGGETVSRRSIVEALGSDYETTDPARLDTQMRRLRRKVAEATGKELPIKTLRNEGYQFYAPAAIE